MLTSDSYYSCWTYLSLISSSHHSLEKIQRIFLATFQAVTQESKLFLSYEAATHDVQGHHIRGTESGSWCCGLYGQIWEGIVFLLPCFTDQNPVTWT